MHLFMKKLLQLAPRPLNLTLGAVLAVCIGVEAPSADAQTFLKFTSEPGDFIGQGQTRIFTPTDSTFSPLVSQDNREIAISLTSAGSSWELHMAAPTGTKLGVGIYENAIRWPFQELSTPGLSFYGDGRGCNTLTGRFEVLEAVYAPFGYIERFHATFEQHCEGGSPALLGEVQIVNPPPPPPLTLSLTLDRKGKVQRASGSATISGTIQCSQATTVQLSGTLTQRVSRTVLSSGFFGLATPCSTTPTPWTARVTGFGVPFVPGPAEIEAAATGVDPNFGAQVTVRNNALIQLDGGKR